MSTSTNSDNIRINFGMLLLFVLPLFVVAGLQLYETHHNVETFNATIYRISTTGATSGSQWRFAGLGGGDISNSADYFAKGFKSLPDGSIQFTTLDGSQVHCTNYKASRFEATFKKKIKYNQVFFIHPQNGHWVQVVDPHLLVYSDVK